MNILTFYVIKMSSQFPVTKLSRRYRGKKIRPVRGIPSSNLLVARMLQNTGGSRKNISKISNMTHQFSACGGLEHWFLNLYFNVLGLFCGSEFSRGQLERLSVTGAQFSLLRIEHYWWNVKLFSPQARKFPFINMEILIKLKMGFARRRLEKYSHNW